MFDKYEFLNNINYISSKYHFKKLFSIVNESEDEMICYQFHKLILYEKHYQMPILSHIGLHHCGMSSVSYTALLTAVATLAPDSSVINTFITSSIS